MSSGDFPQQDVVGSNPITYSIKIGDDLHRGDSQHEHRN